MRLAVRDNLVFKLLGRPHPIELSGWDTQLAAKTAELGFRAIEVGLSGNPAEMPTAKLIDMRRLFADHGVAIGQMWSEASPLLRATEKERRASLDRFCEYMRVARDLGVVNVVVALGTFHATSHWARHPDNWSERAMDLLVASFRAAAPVAEDMGVHMAPECYRASPLNSPWRVRQLISRVNSPAMRVNVDAANMIRFDQVYDTTAALNKLFDLYGRDIGGGHAKDVTIPEEPTLIETVRETYAGNGTLDYATFLRRFDAQAAPDACLCVEHNTPEDVVPAKEYIERIAGKEGLVFQ